MSHPRTARLTTPFNQAATAYLSDPGVLTGMELTEIAGQLKQAAASELRDDALVELLHRLLQAVRGGDAPQAKSLIETVGTRLDRLDTGSRPREQQDG